MHGRCSKALTTKTYWWFLMITVYTLRLTGSSGTVDNDADDHHQHHHHHRRWGWWGSFWGVLHPFQNPQKILVRQNL
jgi:hypothetical protein